MLISIKSKGKHNIQSILDKLKKVKTYDNGGIDFYSAFDCEHVIWMFLSILDFKVNLAPSSKKKILSKAISKILNTREFESENFLKLIDESLKNHLRKKEKTFFLLGTLSINNLPLRKINFGESDAKIYKKCFPKPLANNRKDFLINNRFDNDIPGYLKIVVQVKSKNFEDAFLEGIEKFEILRSLLCLMLNKSTEIRYGNNPKPINLVRAGEVFTLHDIKGECAHSNSCWTSDNYDITKIQALSDSRKAEIKKKLPSIFKKFSGLNEGVRHVLQKALNVYVTAFDETDKHLCFLKAWIVLEILLNSDRKDQLIQRVVSIYHEKDKVFVRQDLECLKEYRNEYVHSGNQYVDPLIACFRLQKYIRAVVNYHLRISSQFENLNESINFLDTYKLQKDTLRKKKRILDMALKIKEKNIQKV